MLAFFTFFKASCFIGLKFCDLWWQQYLYNKCCYKQSTTRHKLRSKNILFHCLVPVKPETKSVSNFFTVTPKSLFNTNSKSFFPRDFPVTDVYSELHTDVCASDLRWNFWRLSYLSDTYLISKKTFHKINIFFKFMFHNCQPFWSWDRCRWDTKNM